MVTPAEVEVRDLARRARASLEQRRGQLLQLKADLERLKGELAERQRYRELCTQVAALLRTAAEQARRDAREQVELLVTDALRYVFGPHLEFQVVTQERAGRSEAEFYVVSSFGSQRVQNRPQDARGGGVVDVVSLALRAALLLLARPPLEGPIVLDEPAKHVSEEYIARVASFLKETSSSFGRQVIMVTHNQHLAHTGDRAYLVEM
ncbi:MAG: ATP-binding protein, partial [Bacillota bacterium]|nr:ATP-binding protein [Bacillota bacterium]